MISPTPDRIVYCYGKYQQLFCQYAHVEYHQGLPDIDDFDGTKVVLLIIDHIMHETDERVANRNIGVVYIAQNLFRITNLRET